MADIENARQAFAKIGPIAQCPWHMCILQDKLQNVFSYDSMEDHVVKFKCSPENFRGLFLRRPFQALSNLQISNDKLKSANLYLHASKDRTLLECSDAIAGSIEFASATSPNLYFLETDSQVYLELDCTFDGNIDIDEVPDFLGTCLGYRFKMPLESTVMGFFKCPEATLQVSWDAKSQCIEYKLDDSESDSDVSDIIEEVLYEEHQDSSDLRTILM